jgi:hypothetical protein
MKSAISMMGWIAATPVPCRICILQAAPLETTPTALSGTSPKSELDFFDIILVFVFGFGGGREGVNSLILGNTFNSPTFIDKS